MGHQLNPYIQGTLATAANTEDYNKFLAEGKRHKDFLKKTEEFNQAFGALEGTSTGDDVDLLQPVGHRFADGLYIREWEAPPDMVTVSAIHNQSNPIFLMEGDVTVLTENGADRLSAPWYTITAAGTQRILYTHTKTKFITVHRSDLLDADSMRDELTFGHYDDVVRDYPEVEQIAKFIKHSE